MIEGYKSLLRNRDFMFLLVAQIFSQLADRAVFVLFVAVLTAQETLSKAAPTEFHAPAGAAQMTSWLYVAFTIPAVLLSPLAGVYVDRASNRSVMVFSNVVRGICVALVSMPSVERHPMLAYFLAFLTSIGAQFFAPAETSSIPRLVKHEDLYHANSLFFTTMMIALGFGFAAGEPIISHVGLADAPFFIACCFFVAALLLCFVKDNVPHKENREPWWEELRFGLAYISSNATVFRAIMKITILFSTIITLNIIAVALSQQVLHIKPFQFGWIVAAAGLGMCIGNFVTAHYGQKMKPTALAYLGFTGIGLFMSLSGSLGFIQTLVLPELGLPESAFHSGFVGAALLLSIFTGFCCAMVAVPTQASLQAAVPENLRGKVFGAQNTAMSAASTIPVILAGVAADNLPGGVSTTLIIVGVPMLLSGIYHLLRTTRRERLEGIF